MTENFQKQNQTYLGKPLTSQEASKVAQFVSSKFNALKQARGSKEKKWNECIKAFLNQHNYDINDIRKWRSQVYIPLSYEAGTNIYSNLKRALFPTDSAFFSVEARTLSAAEKANYVKAWLLYQLDEMGFITKFGSFLKQLVIIGNSGAAIYWKKVARTVRENVQVPVFDEAGNITEIKEEEQEVEKVIYDGPELELINMLDVVFDPAVSNWEEGLIIHRTYRSYEQVSSNPVYKNTKELKNSNVSKDDPYVSDSVKAFDMEETGGPKGNQVKLYSAYGDFQVDDKVYYDYIAVVANDEHLIRFEPNPYPAKPFIFCVYENVPNELYGVGAIEPGLGIQYLVNTFSNQKADVLSLLINGMWAYVDDGIIDPEEIVAKPGALIAVKDPNNIRPLHPDTTVALSYNEIAQLKAEYQEVTGATKYFTGGTSLDFSKTATEVAALQQAGVIRFSEVIQNIEENALKRVIKLIFLYNTLFHDGVKELNISDDNNPNVINADQAFLIQEYNFRIVGANSSISRDIRVNKLLDFIKIVSSSPLLGSQVNIMELIKSLYRELGFKDENNVFINNQLMQ